MKTMIKTDLIPWRDVDSALLAEMSGLRDSQSCYDNPFFDPEFAAVMAEVRDDVWLALAHDDLGLLAFWPLHKRPDNWARPIGAAFSDWHAPVMRAGVDHMSPDTFLRHVDLKGFTAHGLQPSGPSLVDNDMLGGSGIAYLPDGAGPYLERQRARFPKHAKNLRRAERMIARDFKTMTIVLDDQSEEAFNWLMARKAEQFSATGRHNVLGPDWARKMLALLFKSRFTRLRGRLSTLRLDGQVAAAEFDLLSDKVVHGWVVAYDIEMAGYSVGHLLMNAVICSMEQTGHEMYDLGAGDQSYKKYYESYQLPVAATTLTTGLSARPMAALWRYMERMAPERASSFLQSARRRGDQIFATELTMYGRAKGVFGALLRLGSTR